MKRCTKRNRRVKKEYWEAVIQLTEGMRQQGAPEEVIEMVKREFYKSMVDGKDFEFTFDAADGWKVVDFESERIAA